MTETSTEPELILAQWKEQCDRVGKEYRERLIKILPADTVYLKTVKEWNPLLIIKGPMRVVSHAHSLPVYQDWNAEVKRLKLKAIWRLAVLMKQDIDVLKLLPTKVEEEKILDPDAKCDIVVSLPIDVASGWRENVKCQGCEAGVGYSARLAELIQQDIPVLETMNTLDLPPVIGVPREKYHYKVPCVPYTEWRAECDRLNVSYVERLAYIMKNVLHSTRV